MALEPVDYLRERMRAHTRSVKGRRNPSAIPFGMVMTSIVRDLKDGDPADLGFPEADRAVIEEILSIDRRRLEGEASAPYFDVMREIFASAYPDVVRAGQMMNEAVRAEESGVSEAYEHAVSRLSAPGKEIIETRARARARKLTRSELDFAGVAADVPNRMRGILARACSRALEMRARFEAHQAMEDPEPARRDRSAGRVDHMEPPRDGGARLVPRPSR